MNKNYIFTVLLIMTNAISLAQTAPAIQWQKSLGGDSIDEANSIAQTSDGGYIVAGFSRSNNGDVSGNHGPSDYWIAKLNNSGNIQWQKSLGGSGSEGADCIIQTSDSGYIVAGASSSNDGDVSGHHGDSILNYDYWIVKLNSRGDMQWQKSLGGSGDDAASSIAQTSDGGYVIGGSSDSKDGDVTGNHGTVSYRPTSDYWIVKLNGSGDMQWQKSLGGSGEEFCTSVVQTSDGGYTATGLTESNDDDITGSHGARDCWVVKLNSSGDMQWQKSLGGSGDDVGSSIAQTSDNGYIIGGSSESNDGDVTGNHGYFDCWVVKLNSSGDIQWQKSLGGSDADWANSIAQTYDGGYIAAGYSRSNDGDVTGNHGFNDCWMVKLDSSGSMQWQKSLGGSDGESASSIAQTSDRGYIMGGSSDSNDGDVTGNHGTSDYWVVKLAQDPALSVALTNFSGEVNGKQNLLHWTTVIEQNNTGFEIQHSIDGYNFNKIGFTATKAINGNSNLPLSYDYADYSFALGTNYYRLKQFDKDGKFSYSNIVVLKDVHALAPGLIAVYPNPANNLLNVKLSSQQNNITLLITDLTGKSLLSKTTNIGNGESIVQLDISHLSAGMYFLKIISSDSNENTMMRFTKR